MKSIAATLIVLFAALFETGCSTLADARAARGTGQVRTYAAAPDSVWNALPTAVKEVGLDYVGENRAEGYALAQRGLSAFSYGENVAIYVSGVEKNTKSEVEVISKKSLSTNVFAPNWEKTVLDALSKLLGLSGVASVGENR